VDQHHLGRRRREARLERLLRSPGLSGELVGLGEIVGRYEAADHHGQRDEHEPSNEHGLLVTRAPTAEPCRKTVGRIDRTHDRELLGSYKPGRMPRRYATKTDRL